MKRLRSIAVFVALMACVSCADMMENNPPAPTPDQPVGTTGATVGEPTQVNTSRPGVVPVGQLLDLRLQSSLSSETAQPEQRFDATTVASLMQDGNVLIPAGATVRGVVSSVKHAGRLDRTGSLTLAFDQILVKGREYPIRGMATQVFKSEGLSGEARTVGTAGAVGAIVGGIIGGLKGALLGAVVGGGGVIAATEGEDIVLPPGTIVRIRLDSPLELR